jgi:beta-glucosidase
VFPSDFLWGAAVAAYQVEGAVTEDGRGESIWDRFSTRPGAIRNGDTGIVACDSYHRYREDIRLLRELGVDAFRFSIAWPRIVPRGRGRVNEAGLDFYDRYVDELLAAGIAPVVTLYHWDLPQALEDEGGWTGRETAYAFADFADVVVRRLGDRVGRWITVNEPWVIGWLGYGTGEHAPGRRDKAAALAAGHHALLAHGLATDVLRAGAPHARVGITIDLVQFDPLSDTDADREAVRRIDGSRNRWFLDAVLRGGYPEDVLEDFAPLAPPVRDADPVEIAKPIDFLGVNYYTRNVVRGGSDGAPLIVDNEAERTGMGWEVYPEGLTRLLVRLHDEYDVPPILVTENGAAYPDTRTSAGVHDPERASYVERHLAAIEAATDRGVPVHGYFIWSLLDNFEWAFGYTQRFGLVYVDFETLERVPKTSFASYRSAIAARRPALAAVAPAPQR